DVSVAALAAVGLHARPGRDPRLRVVLRDAHAGAVAVVGPAVVAADDVAVIAEALRQPGRAVAAAIPQRGGPALGVEPQHDVLAEQSERLRPRREPLERHHAIPIAAQHLLFRDQHAYPSGPLEVAG